jgi:DNA topoisomerase IB
MKVQFLWKNMKEHQKKTIMWILQYLKVFLKFIKKDSVQRFIEQNLSPPPKMYELTPNQNKKRKFEEQYQESLNLKETRLFLFLIQFL